MRTEEANRLKDKMSSLSLNSSKTNLVKSSVSLNRDSFKHKKDQKQSKHQNKLKRTNSKIHKQKVVCYVCEKPGHKAFQCDLHKGANHTNQKPAGQIAAQANLTEHTEIFCAVTLEVNLVSNSTEWSLDTGATRHFCANKDLMHDFEDAPDGEHVYMDNAATAGVIGKGKVLL